MRFTLIFLISLTISFVSEAADLKVNQISFIGEDSINLREKPDVTSNKVTSLNKFAKVKILSFDPKIVTVKKWKGRWIKVQSEEKTGYVLDSFLMKNHESIIELLPRDTFWETDSSIYQLGKMSKTGDIESQGALSFTKETTENVEWGTVDGKKSCSYKFLFSTGNQILIFCDKYNEVPDQMGEGERRNVLILLEKVNKTSLKIINFGFDA